MVRPELKNIDVSDVPELLRIAEEVKRSGEPCVLKRDSEELAVLSPVTRLGSVRRGRRTSANDPLWNIVGIGRSEGPTDVARNKHKYLAEAYAAKHG